MTSVSNVVSQSIVRAMPASVDLTPASIPLAWVLDGSPQAWNKIVARNRDRMSQIVVWECTAGLFMWHYQQDESVFVISGEAFLVEENGHEVRFGPGDVGFFPAGTTCTWRVPGPFRKVAVMQEPIWKPLGFAVKAWHRLLEMVGLTERVSLMITNRATFSEPPRQVG
ncbi:MAG: cupin domain-containing protein [Candidatus Sulfotelmatobacter sp.]